MWVSFKLTVFLLRAHLNQTIKWPDLSVLPLRHVSLLKFLKLSSLIHIALTRSVSEIIAVRIRALINVCSIISL